MQLSVVIPCLNGVHTLGAQLDALAEQRWDRPWEVIVADNGSTDGSLELLKSYQQRMPNLRIVDASRHRGQPFATNAGARASEAVSLAFVDADDVVADGWVAAIGDALDEHEFVACRTDGDVLNPPGLRASPQKLGLQPGWFPPFLPHAGGGTIGLRRELFLKLGEFDEALPYVGDVEYCTRAGLQGVQIHFVPAAVLYLRNRPSFRSHLRQAMNWSEWGVVLAERYASTRNDARALWRKYFADWVELLRLVPKAARYSNERYRLAQRLGRQIGRTKGVWRLRGGAPV